MPFHFVSARLFLRPLRWAAFIGVSLFLVPQSRALSPEEQEQKRVEKIQQEIQKQLESAPKVQENGQESVRISLEDFVEYYVAVHPSTQQLNYATMMADEQQGLATGRFTPNVNLSATQNQSPLQFSGDATTTAALTDSAKVAFSQLTPIGVSYSVAYQANTIQSYLYRFDRAYDIKKYSRAKAPQLYNNILSFNLNIPIFQDFGSPVSADKRKAQLNYQKALNQRQLSLNNLTVSLVGVYLDLKSLIAQTQALKQRSELSDRLLFETQERVRVGLLPQTALLAQEAQALADKSSWEEAQNALLSLADTIKGNIGVADLPYGIVPADAFSAPNLDASAAALEREILDYSLETKNLTLEQEAIKQDLAAADNKLRPNVDLNLNYNIYGYGTKREETSLVNDHKLNPYTATLSWNIPLGNDGSRSLANTQRLLLAQKAVQVNTSLDNIKIKAKSDIRSLDLQRNRLEASKKQVEIRKILLNREVEKYKLGQSSTNDVATAQTQLFQAIQGLAASESNFAKAYYAIEVSRGRIYQYFPRLKELLDNPNP